MKKFLFPIVLIAIVLTAFIGYGCSKQKSPKRSSPLTVEETLTTITLEEILKPASELVSLKYCYTDADFYEQSKSAFGVKVPFTTDKVVFTYSGKISAGIDISEVNYDIDDDKKTITITLPEPQILSHEMDEKDFKFFDVKNSVFTETTLENYSSLIAELKEKKKAQLEEDDEFYKSVTENAETVLKNFLTVSDKTKDYTVIFN